MTVVFAVVTRTFNEDKLMISQRKIMYHMARSPRPPCHARNLMPPKPGDDDRDKAETIANRDDVDDDGRCTIARRSSDVAADRE